MQFTGSPLGQSRRRTVELTAQYAQPFSGSESSFVFLSLEICDCSLYGVPAALTALNKRIFQSLRDPSLIRDDWLRAVTSLTVPSALINSSLLTAPSAANCRLCMIVTLHVVPCIVKFTAQRQDVIFGHNLAASLSES